MILRRYSSPVGSIILMVAGGKLVYCNWEDKECEDKFTCLKRRFEKVKGASDKRIITSAKKQLDEYFKGERKAFNLPISFNDTLFRMQIWENLKGIPYGKTITYKELASTSGNAKAVRAAANACGANPLAIIIPCHRIVGSNGNGGYTGGNDKKIFLLNLESLER
ncbi:MAG: methylated-DNA--[protein]-cysteine S-methyltransferase [Muribaculaceae bacterium]|nr:methylated-DNA--[protein]-cysteine S-methyltransferase [Muribaculaceae bacterium]